MDGSELVESREKLVATSSDAGILRMADKGEGEKVGSQRGKKRGVLGS